jgi:hypothetical protein
MWFTDEIRPVVSAFWNILLFLNTNKKLLTCFPPEQQEFITFELKRVEKYIARENTLFNVFDENDNLIVPFKI